MLVPVLDCVTMLISQVTSSDTRELYEIWALIKFFTVPGKRERAAGDEIEKEF